MDGNVLLCTRDLNLQPADVLTVELQNMDRTSAQGHAKIRAGEKEARKEKGEKLMGTKEEKVSAKATPRDGGTMAKQTVGHKIRGMRHHGKTRDRQGDNRAQQQQPLHQTQQEQTQLNLAVHRSRHLPLAQSNQLRKRQRH